MQALQPITASGLYVTDNGDGSVWTSPAADYRHRKVTVERWTVTERRPNIDGFFVNLA